MTVRRLLTSPATAGLDLRLDYGTVTVVVGTVRQVEVELSTQDPDDSPAAKAIRDTTLTNPSLDGLASRSGELVAQRDTYARVRIPDQPPTVFSGVQMRGGGVYVQNVFGGVHMGSGRTYVNEVEITPDGARHGIEVEVRLPVGAALRVDTDGAAVTHLGDPLAAVAFDSVSGALRLRQCLNVVANSTSGAITAEVADRVLAETVSGRISIGKARDVDARSTSGRVGVDELYGNARVNNVSGRVEVHAYEPGEVDVRTVSGRITVTDPRGLARTGQLRVRAKTVSGRKDTP